MVINHVTNSTHRWKPLLLLHRFRDGLAFRLLAAPLPFHVDLLKGRVDWGWEEAMGKSGHFTGKSGDFMGKSADFTAISWD